MSNTTHTPEPWRFLEEEMKIKGSGDIEGRTVIANLSPKMDYSRGMGTQCANAARIVACVNAMRGIDDPQQFVTNSLKNGLELLQARVQRDELLAVLKELVELNSKRDNDDPTTFFHNDSWFERKTIAWQTAKELIEKFEKP